MNELVVINRDKLLSDEFQIAQSKNNNMGFVYILENKNSMIKIGRTMNPKTRMKALEAQTGIPIKNVCLSPICSNYCSIETSLHHHFKNKRGMGEWFNISMEEAMEILRNVVFDLSVPNDKEQNKSQWIREATIKSLLGYFKEMYGEQIEIEINSDSWIPDDSDIKLALKDMQELSDSYRYDCDEKELADKVDAEINIVKQSPYSVRSKKIIQQMYIEMINSVCVEDLIKCYGSDLVAFMTKVLGVNFVDLHEKWIRQKLKDS